MSDKPELDDAAAAELHDRLANQIVSQIVNEPIAAGGTMSDVMMLCESVVLGVVLSCSRLGGDVKILDVIVTRVKERLAKARLENLAAEGEG
jgi:hypothetical protein